MRNVAITILVVLGMLALGYPRRDLVIAKSEKAVVVFGHELRFNLSVELVKVQSAEAAMAEARGCELAADTLEAQ